jgi:hypothetical protein
MPEIRVNDAELFYVDQDLDCDAAPRAVQNPGIARLNTRSGWPGARTSRLCSKKAARSGAGCATSVGLRPLFVTHPATLFESRAAVD